jgi:hypothetical protein
VNELWATVWRVLRDPRISASVVLGFSALGGLVLIVAGYWGTADLRLVVYQFPFLVSGGIGGIGLLGLSLSLLSVHFDRVASIEERRELAQLQRATMRLVRDLEQRRRQPSGD